jgi:membrane protein implicated in regulation of membrane protease activity
MVEYMVWFWLGLFLFALLLEIFTADMISIWFSLAAVPSFILALVGAGLVFQILLFLVIAAVLLFLTRPIMKKYMKTNEIKTNIDAIIGSKGLVIKEITPDTVGRIKIKYIEWSAISSEKIGLDHMVRVLDVDGNKLIVEKIEE